LDSKSPLPVFIAKVTRTLNPSTIRAVLSDGEVCNGKWELVHPATVAKGATEASDPGANQMAAEWDTVYGAGFYVAHVLGTRYYARTVATGNKGTILNAEIYRPVGNEANQGDVISKIKGVAKDSKGNLYKIVF